jgi:hypothetical protein
MHFYRLRSTLNAQRSTLNAQTKEFDMLKLVTVLVSAGLMVACASTQANKRTPASQSGRQIVLDLTDQNQIYAAIKASPGHSRVVRGFSEYAMVYDPSATIRRLRLTLKQEIRQRAEGPNPTESCIIEYEMFPIGAPTPWKGAPVREVFETAPWDETSTCEKWLAALGLRK